MPELETLNEEWEGLETFRGQEPGEKVIALFRQSLFVHLTSLLAITACLVLPFVALHYFGASAITSGVIGIAIFGVITQASKVYFLWTRTLVLVTSIRVIYFKQEGVFKHKFEEGYLDDICQVTSNVGGPAASIFKYGTLVVQTEGQMVLEGIARPHDLKHEIFKAMRQNGVKVPADKPEKNDRPIIR